MTQALIKEACFNCGFKAFNIFIDYNGFLYYKCIKCGYIEKW
jgi:DNA-directed RNA polymerase subunit RPC12/RpoP